MKKILRKMSTPKSRTFWKTAERSAAEVEKWPAWKRGLDPCEDERCERELGHEGKHRAARPVTFDEW